MALLLADKQLWLPAYQHPDKELIRSIIPESLELLVEGCLSKGWVAGAADSLTQFAMDALDDKGDYGLAVLNDTHVFLYDIVDVFWLQNRCLVEYMLLRYKPGDAHGAFTAIDQMAKHYGVPQVVISTSAAVRDDAYCRFLKQQGYQLGAKQFVKDVR